jgi:hypothetical protein
MLGVRGDVVPSGVSLRVNPNYEVMHKLYTGCQRSVDKVLAGVYSYTQAKSYIRVRIVDKY